MKAIIIGVFVSILGQGQGVNLYEIGKANKSLPWALTGLAIKMQNSTKTNLQYFYANKSNDGQKRWYEHSIKSGHATWDWGWSNWNTSNSIEFQFNTGSDKKQSIVIVYEGCHSNSLNSTQWYAHLGIYWCETNQNVKNPSWNSQIWQQKYYDTREWSDDADYHIHLEFSQNGIFDTTFGDHINILSF